MVDPRIERTQRDLSNALLVMLRTKELNEISIKDLCDNAHINRSTFYVHYRNIREILDDLETDFLNQFSIFKSIYSGADRIQMVMVARYENELMNILLRTTNLENDLYRSTLTQLSLRYQNSEIANHILSITANYIVSGTLSIMKNCISNITTVSDEEIASLINRLNTQAISILDTESSIQKIAI